MKGMINHPYGMIKLEPGSRVPFYGSNSLVFIGSEIISEIILEFLNLAPQTVDKPRLTRLYQTVPDCNRTVLLNLTQLKQRGSSYLNSNNHRLEKSAITLTEIVSKFQNRNISRL